MGSAGLAGAGSSNRGPEGAGHPIGGAIGRARDAAYEWMEMMANSFDSNGSPTTNSHGISHTMNPNASYPADPRITAGRSQAHSQAGRSASTPSTQSGSMRTGYGCVPKLIGFCQSRPTVDFRSSTPNPDCSISTVYKRVSGTP